jgi:hypothetical protein
VSIRVNPVNDKPTVNALTADPTTINEGEGISHLAASATDPEDNPLTYSWSQISGTDGVITVDSTDSTKATFEAPSVSADETARIQVTVNDGSNGGTDTKTVDVTVKNVNQAPLAKLTADPTTINEGAGGVTSRLDASESSDPDGDSLTYSFTILDNGPGSIRDQTGATATYEAPSDVTNDQTVTIQVEVNDGNGGTDTATAQILVKDIPAPEVEVTRAVDRTGKEIAEGGTTPVPYIRISFEITSLVAIDKIECSLDEKPFEACSSPVVYDKLSRGDHTVTVRAINEAGKTGEDQFKWIVGAPPSRGTEEEDQTSSPALEKEQKDQPSVASTERASTEDTYTEEADADAGTDADTHDDTLTESQSHEPVEESSDEGGEENSRIEDTS